jgi:polyisoprenoid-binding protein YceI
MKHKILFTLACLTLHFTAAATSLKATNGYVRFTAIGKPGFLKIRGESGAQRPEGKIELRQNFVEGEFSFDLSKLKTGIELRDEHMKTKYLEVDKFPLAKLVLTPIPMTPQELKQDVTKAFKGMLTLHGVTREISGTSRFRGNEQTIDAKFNIELSDYGIAIPEHMGITVSKVAEVEVHLKLQIGE